MSENITKCKLLKLHINRAPKSWQEQIINKVDVKFMQKRLDFPSEIVLEFRYIKRTFIEHL